MCAILKCLGKAAFRMSDMEFQWTVTNILLCAIYTLYIYIESVQWHRFCELVNSPWKVINQRGDEIEYIIVIIIQYRLKWQHRGAREKLPTINIETPNRLLALKFQHVYVYRNTAYHLQWKTMRPKIECVKKKCIKWNEWKVNEWKWENKTNPSVSDSN